MTSSPRQWDQGSGNGDAFSQQDSNYNNESSTMADATATPIGDNTMAVTETPPSIVPASVPSKSSFFSRRPAIFVSAFGAVALLAVVALLGIALSGPSSFAEAGRANRAVKPQRPRGSGGDGGGDGDGAPPSIPRRLWETKLHRAFAKEFGASATEVSKEVVERKGKDAPSGAVVFAPQVILEVLAMLREGAGGETRRELNGFLGEPGVYENNNQKPLKALTDKLVDFQKEGGEFRFGSALFVDKSVKGDGKYEEYEKRVKGKFAADVRLADFLSNPKKSTEEINDFVNDTTAGRISKLLDVKDLSPDAKLVLVSAMFFKAKWALRFEPEATFPQEFTTIVTEGAKEENGKQVMMQQQPKKKTTMAVPNVLCMHREFDEDDLKKGAHFFVSDDVTVAELPYKAEGWKMVVVMPNDATKFEDFETSTLEEKPKVVDEYVAAARAAERQGPVALTLPKFRIEGEVKDIEPVLSELGIRKMFSHDADFSEITNRFPLMVDKFVTSAMIEVAEEGTAAAGAAGAGIMMTSLGPEPEPVTFNKPFMAFIRYSPPGAKAPEDDITAFQLRITNPLPLQSEFKEEW